MKKLLLLFTTILLTSCTSEGDDTSKNFLEKYNGVYWVSNDSSDGQSWVQFSLTNFIQCEGYDNESCICDNPVSWGGTFANGGTLTIKENGLEKLIINASFQIVDTALSFDLNIKTVNDGNGIEILYPAGFENENESTETFTRFNSQPCN